MILVIDIQKGFETQTAECLILAEITKKPMLVVLNKIDLLVDEAAVEKVKVKVQKTLEPTIFRKSKIIPVSALASIKIDELWKALLQEAENMNIIRNTSSPFIFAFDHCFSIKGSGTVLSGTVLQGSIKVNDTIEISHLKTSRKVKSMQMFRKAVNSGAAGDRLGLCITNFDPKQLERGLIFQGETVQSVLVVIVKIEKIRYFKRKIETKAKFHCSVGHQTVMGKILLFSSSKSSTFDWDNEFSYEEDLQEDPERQCNYFALIEFENHVMAHDGMLLIGSKLDTEESNVCRLAFHGKIFLKNSSGDKNYHESFLPHLKVFKTKSRKGLIQRVVNDYEVIASNLFKKETDRSKFVGMKCQLSSGEIGTIIGSFGQSEKVRIQLTSPIHPTTAENPNNRDVQLKFKKFLFNKNHQMIQ